MVHGRLTPICIMRKKGIVDENLGSVIRDEDIVTKKYLDDSLKEVTTTVDKESIVSALGYTPANGKDIPKNRIYLT